jgi:NAD(P)-dependent dehydrogenase (short-subunit alcohol dehydrogenase family)
MSLTSILITGANRGIGLEFVRQLLSLSPQPKYIIATSRQSTNEELDKLKATNDSLHVLKLDTKNYDEYQHFVSQVGQIVGNHGIDLLINNAGILLKDDIESVNPKNMLENFEVNAVTPLMITKALLPLLKVCLKFIKFTVCSNFDQLIYE